MTDSRLPRGFVAAGLSCGIKESGAADLALFVSETPCATAGVFTRNRVCGAPVQVSRERVPRGTGRGVIVNSGNANACTGERGLDDARWMTERVAADVGCDAEDVLVLSTGVIGHFLPREKLEDGLPRVAAALGSTEADFLAAAEGMMTTDTVSKQCVREIEVDGRTARVSGACKGAAMIAPNMATMLAVVMTDAALTPERCDAMLRHAVDRSFNCISVEGHTSTSDAVLLFANGAAVTGELDAEAEVVLQRAIDEVCAELARMIVRDAEGAEHFVVIDVHGARSRDEGRTAAKAIAESDLVKTGITGNDPNWGRIVSCLGYCGIDVEEADITLAMNGFPVYERGAPVPHDPKTISDAMATGEVHLEVSLSHGDANVRFWTCDLTAEYVRLNAEYTT